MTRKAFGRSEDLRFGVLTLPSRPIAEMIQLWELSEAIGFDDIWLADHFAHPWGEEKEWFDGWSLMGVLALATESVRIGMLVSSMTLRAPAMLARQATTVDHISNGRLELGIGLGGTVADHRMTGVPVWASRERVRRFSEYIEIVDGMLRHSPYTYDGSHYSVDETVISPPPMQKPRPPLVVGSNSKPVFRIAIKYADCINLFVPKGTAYADVFQTVEKAMKSLAQCCADAETSVASLRVSLLTNPTYIDRDLWTSRTLATDYIDRMADLGVDELIFGWPGRPGGELLGEVLEDVRRARP